MFHVAAISCNWKCLVNISQRFSRVTLIRQLQRCSSRKAGAGLNPAFPNGTYLTQWDCFDIWLQLVKAETFRGQKPERGGCHLDLGGGGDPAGVASSSAVVAKDIY